MATTQPQQQQQLVAGSLGESLGLQRTPEAIAAITAARDAHMPAPGTVTSASDVAAATDAVTAALESTLDLHLLSTLLELTKGQRLLARGMFVLHPQVLCYYLSVLWLHIVVTPLRLRASRSLVSVLIRRAKCYDYE